MSSFANRRFGQRVSVWEGPYGPTRSSQAHCAGPARVAGPGPAGQPFRPAQGPELVEGRPPHQDPVGPSSVLRLQSSAFTLLELLVVIALVAVLSGIVFGVGRRAAESGRTARARAELVALTAALDSYRLAHGDYPRTNLPARLLQSVIGRRGPDGLPIDGRASLECVRFATTGGLDPFASEAAELLDPWGQPYRYAYKSQVPWTNPSYVLYSAGPDGSDTAELRPGGFPDASATGNGDNLSANQP